MQDSDRKLLIPLPRLGRPGHASHCKNCLAGLPASQLEIDSSRLILGFYCLGTFDLLDTIQSKSEVDRELWKEWIWEQQSCGKFGTGFKPSSYMTSQSDNTAEYSEYDPPNIIATYTALLSLSILRDDFVRLDRPGIVKFLQKCQEADGSFSTLPNGGEADLRSVYCAFAISSMLDDWSGIDIQRATNFISKCRTYEGGYGQSPSCEALGGTTYCALAALYLAPRSKGISPLTTAEHRSTVRWLINNQDSISGGFCGRTEKAADACYCFWCGASLQILGASEIVDVPALASFFNKCQFKFGGIAKSPGEDPDPYHTYMALASLSIYTPKQAGPSWDFGPLDPLLNASEATAQWAREHIPAS